MGLEATDGQANADLSNETTVAAPDASGEQSVASTQTTDTGPGSEDIESFFDPKSIEGKPELESAYKQMQSEFTKRLNGISGSKDKIDAYDAFLADPQGTLRQLAAQYGLNLIDGNDAPQMDKDFDPKSWADVKEYFRADFLKEAAAENAPLINEVRDLKKQNVESMMDKDYPDWRIYETGMIDALQKYPKMANDHHLLYRMSVPKEILEQRSMKQALAKIKGETGSSFVGDNKTTSVPTTEGAPGNMSFSDAVKFAKQQLQSQGLAGPVAE